MSLVGGLRMARPPPNMKMLSPCRTILGAAGQVFSYKTANILSWKDKEGFLQGKSAVTNLTKGMELLP